MLVTLDFETYWDKDYSLKKLSTSEYVRDSRFEAICMAYKVDGPVVVSGVAWGHDDISKVLQDIDWSRAEALAHHCHFEGLVLSHHFGVRPRAYRDTLSMARVVTPKNQDNDLASLAARLGVENKLAMPDFKGLRLAQIPVDLRKQIEEYVFGDVVSCRQAYDKLLPLMPPGEMDVMDVVVRMFADPVIRLDVPRAQAELEREVAAKAALVAAAGVTPEVLQSSAKLASKMLELGVKPPMKFSSKQQKWVPAMAQTDLEFSALKTHPVVGKLVEARLAVKSTQAETRAQRLIKSASAGSLPVYLNYFGTLSTRMSGGDKLNFQNFKRGSELRRCLMAPQGHVLVVVDSRQIQTRLLAWLSGERWLLDEFATGGDPYNAFGFKAFGREVKKGDVERDLAKACVLALGFGAGAVQLQSMIAWGTYCEPMDLPIEQCEGFVTLYRNTSRNIKNLWYTLQAAIGDMARGRSGSYKVLSWEKDKILLPNGLSLMYPECDAETVEQRLGGMFGDRTEEKVLNGSYASVSGRAHIYGGLITADVMQALERAIVAEQMRQIAKRYRVGMMSHDEVVLVVRKEEAQEALDFALAEMRKRPSWGLDIPLDAEGGYAENYSK